MAGRSANNQRARTSPPPPAFPFAAIVGQEEMRLALLLNVIAPSVGGVLVMGHRGTGKSTAVRALADLLPPLQAVRGCVYNCDPADAHALCDACLADFSDGKRTRVERRPVPVVELPLGATEDRVCGTIDFGRALNEGVKSFEPGLLARANRGFLYIDEVNLLEDHLVDLLLDVATTGRNRVEREGISVEHPARFVLVGSGNPEEGELRPQLVDRFGLCVEVETVTDLDSRVRIVELREAFDRDPAGFVALWQGEQTKLRRRVVRAARDFEKVCVPRPLLRSIAELCLRLGVDGHRGEITVTRASRALAAFEGRREATAEDVRRVAAMSLRHRLRRDPLEHGGGGERVQNCVAELLCEPHTSKSGGAREGSGARRPDEPRAELFGEPRAELDGEGRARVDDDAREVVIAPVELSLPNETPATSIGIRRPAARAKRATRRRGDARASFSVKRGRYSGSSSLKEGAAGVALDATLRAAASLCVARAADEAPARNHESPARKLGVQSRESGATAHKAATTARKVEREAVRFKRLRAKAGVLFLFLIDTSGSMALNRIAQAKGALAHLLRRSYVNRDRVSLISFRERGSKLLLAPSGSVSLARRRLDALPVGGATPLAAGLLRALEVSRGVAAHASSRIQLVVFTDGRANVPLNESADSDGAWFKDRNEPDFKLKGQIKSEGKLKRRIRSEVAAIGAALRKEGVSSFVIDTQSRFTSGGEGRFLADALGGRYTQLSQLIGEDALARTLDEAVV